MDEQEEIQYKHGRKLCTVYTYKKKGIAVFFQKECTGDHIFVTLTLNLVFQKALLIDRQALDKVKPFYSRYLSSNPDYWTSQERNNSLEISYCAHWQAVRIKLEQWVKREEAIVYYCIVVGGLFFKAKICKSYAWLLCLAKLTMWVL